MLNIYKTNTTVQTPRYGTADSACFDIAAHVPYMASVKAYTKTNEPVEILAVANSEETESYIEIPSEWRVLVPTGLILDIPKGHCVKIYPRSGLSTKQGINLINSVGIVDADYVEPVYIPVYNNSQNKIKIKNGHRIAQAELVAVSQAKINIVSERPSQKTDRGGGFGSTGLSS
jgi:dUTP pyrophosphatase